MTNENALRLLAYLWREAAVEGLFEIVRVRDLFKPDDPLSQDIEDALTDCPCGHSEDQHVHYCSVDTDAGPCGCDVEYVRQP